MPKDSPFIAMSDGRGRIYEHRLVMAQHKGRDLNFPPYMTTSSMTVVGPGGPSAALRLQSRPDAESTRKTATQRPREARGAIAFEDCIERPSGKSSPPPPTPDRTIRRNGAKHLARLGQAPVISCPFSAACTNGH